MPLPRRALLGFVPTGLITALALPRLARADEPATHAERALGNADAPVSVIEFYSLTCPHCADFTHETFPRVKSELIDTGKLRYVFWDFPLDQVALTAAMVAHYLPPDRYVPFTDALLASQDRWAFARGVNSTDELAKMAALAGLGREQFEKAIADNELKAWILQRQDEAVKTYGIDSTPSFIFNGKAAKNSRESGSIGYEVFARAVAQAAG
jgi:protein-disulfide isomerase